MLSHAGSLFILYVIFQGGKSIIRPIAFKPTDIGSRMYAGNIYFLCACLLDRRQMKINSSQKYALILFKQLQ